MRARASASVAALAVSRRWMPSDLAYTPMVGLRLFSSGLAISSTVASPMPTVFSVRLTITSPSLRAASRGATSLAHIPVISAGGPGIATTMPSAFSTHQPGAVPRGLGRIVPEGMIVACLMLRAGMSLPRPAKKARSVAAAPGSTRASSPTARAMASRVMSSSVGPRPPVQMTTSERSSAVRISPPSRSTLSPTWCM